MAGGRQRGGKLGSAAGDEGLCLADSVDSRPLSACCWGRGRSGAFLPLGRSRLERAILLARSRASSSLNRLDGMGGNLGEIAIAFGNEAR